VTSALGRELLSTQSPCAEGVENQGRWPPQPSTNEMTDVRLARGQPGDGLKLVEAAQARWRAVNAPQPEA
jgi:hypothetical protein